MSIKIEHYHGINYTPAVGIIVKAQHYLLHNNLSEPLISIMWDDEVILAYTDENRPPVGVMTWKYLEWMKTINVHIGYVEMEYRRHGVYKTMWHALVEKAKELNAKSIVSTTHLPNEAMRATARSLGRVELSVNLVYRL